MSRSDKFIERDEIGKRYVQQRGYHTDICPPVDSPEFLKKFPLDLSRGDEFQRVLAARTHGYGD